MRVSALEGSSWEHLTFEQDFQVDSVSADKGIGVANQAGIPVLHLTAQNATPLPSNLQQPAAVLADVQNWLSQGLTVDVPATAVTRDSWTGSIWVVEDPVSGGAAYLIAGGLAGGASAESPDQWTLQFAANALADPYGTVQPNADPLSAASLVIVSATNNQMGQVGTLLPAQLAVVARDASGKPVQGATVTFTTAAGTGGGTLVDPATSAESTSVAVVTDPLGHAAVTIRLGQQTAASPAFLLQSPTDAYATQALVQLVDASVSTHDGALSPDAPFYAYGFPGPPATIVSQEPSQQMGGNPGMYAGDVHVQVQDSYGNSISNVPVTFAVGPAARRDDVQCNNPPGSNQQNAAVFDDVLAPNGNLAACPIPSPILGSCGGPSVVTTTNAYGTGAGVILGNDVAAMYWATISTPATSPRSPRPSTPTSKKISSSPPRPSRSPPPPPPQVGSPEPASQHWEAAPS